MFVFHKINSFLSAVFSLFLSLVLQVSYQNGFLQFYSSADVTTIFDKPSYHQGYASAHSDDASCRLITKASVSGTKISIFQDLNISLSGQRGKFACAFEKKYGQVSFSCD